MRAQIVRRLIHLCIGISFLFLLLAQPSFGADTKGLKPEFKKWLERDVAYLISRDERNEFLSLRTDAERESFMTHFWEVRNPNPGAPDNAYQMEIYRRIAYANQWFGTPGGDNGWRTDRGRVYITLGEPKQRNKQPGGSETRPFEIWFYENANPALPPYFYIVFYQRDIGDEYRIYSPRFDGPQALTTNTMTVNNNREAFDRIDREFGREVSRATLSLIPGEPIDTDTCTGSITSDFMLAILRNLPNHPMTKQMIAHNADLLSSVSHRMVLTGEYLDAMTVTFRDGAGDTYVHYLLRVRQALDFAVAKKDDKYYYNTEIAITVRDEKGREVLSQVYPLSRYLTEQQFETVKSSPFGVEGVLPLPAGKYKIELLLANKLKNTAWKTERDLVVPGSSQAGLSLSSIMGFSSVLQEPRFVPFNLGGFKFTPQANDELTVVQDQALTVMYQMWLTPGELKQMEGKSLHVEYTYGQLGASEHAKKLEEDIAVDQFDPNGSLLTGKKLPTAGMMPGNYRLVVAATDPLSGRKVYSSLNFRVNVSLPPSPWDTFDERIPVEYVNGEFDVARGHALLTMNRPDEARAYFERAIKKDKNNSSALEGLTNVFFRRGDYGSVMKLYELRGVDSTTSEATILNFAQSFANSGKVPEAIKVVETALSARAPSEPLYLALLTFYDSVGDTGKSGLVKSKLESLKKQ